MSCSNRHLANEMSSHQKHEEKLINSEKENPAARTIHGSSFWIDISDNYSGDTCSLYEINQTGMFIWNNIDGTRSSKGIS